MKMITKKFEGQLSGQVAKEGYFSKLRSERKLELPSVGKAKEYNLPVAELNGAFLSILDGAGSLTVNGKKVSKMKVYAGEEKIPATFTLTFKVERVSDIGCKLSADIIGK